MKKLIGRPRWLSQGDNFNRTSYLQESPSSEALRARQYERLQDWSPSEEMDRPFSKANSDSPPFGRLNKRFGKQMNLFLTTDFKQFNSLNFGSKSTVFLCCVCVTRSFRHLWTNCHNSFSFYIGYLSSGSI